MQHTPIRFIILLMAFSVFATYAVGQSDAKPTNKENDLPKSAKQVTTQNADAVIALNSMNVLYMGLDNEVTAVANGVKPENLGLRCSNGTVSGSNSKYKIAVFVAGNVTLSLYNKETGAAIKSFEYVVKRVPEPVNGKVTLGVDMPVKIVTN